MATKAERWVLIVLAVLGAAVLVRPLLHADPMFGYFDDFFYYLVPARHFVATGTFAFFPGMATNGFQPLWMGVIVAFVWLSHGHLLLFCSLTNATLLALYVLSCVEAARLLREAKASAVASFAGVVLAAAMQLNIAVHGMEVAATVPLLLLLTRRLLAKSVAERSRRERVVIGLLTALVILSRVDSALLLAPLAVTIAIRERPSLRALGPLAIGMLPLGIYLAVNVWAMHTVLPISGTAKMLKGLTAPSTTPLDSLFFVTDSFAQLAFVYVLVVGVALVAPVARPDGPRDAALRAAAAGLLLYYAAFSFLTDWALWSWYKYPLAWAAVLGCARLGRGTLHTVERAVAAAAVVMLGLMFVVRVRHVPEQNHLYDDARAVARFAGQHPGRYAMGDCAGVTGYALGDRSLLQLEGLVGDRELLELVRERAPLRRVLDRYRIDYYVAVAVVPKDGCYALREPGEAGPRSPVMLGRACAPPLMHYGELDVFRVSDVQ